MQVCHICGKDIPALVRFCSWCGSPTPRTTSTGLLSPQSLLHHGRYLILKQVGKGGMAAVYKAHDLHLRQRTVAIKEMSLQGLSGPELQRAINAFIHEAELLARLKHQNLPHIYEQFEDAGRRYLVMEFIEGETLEDRLETAHQRGSKLPLAQALRIIQQLCTVLDYLHSQQPPIIFRDLKPANIMLNQQQQIYLIDFGIARLFKPGQSKDTTALGSPGYAPPEQYRQATSPRSDIYSLGATLHQMLTGIDPSQHPFYFQPFSINQPRLERLVQRMVALDEKQRPANMQAVKQSLEGIGQPHKPQQSHSLPKTQKSQAAPPSAQKNTRQNTINGIQTQKNRLQPHLNNHNSSQAAQSAPITVHTVISTNSTDRHLWLSIREQLHKLIDGFPDIRFTESNLPGALKGVDIVLLLLSSDFLASTSCMASASTALKLHDTRQTRVLSIVLRPCAWEQEDLASFKTIPEDSVTHLSIYAQEQRILEAAKEVRKLVAVASLKGKTAGTMNLLQWLLWQLYGDGRRACPYFKVETSSRYALQHLRSSGLAGIILHLIDLQQERVVTEYLIGPLNNSPDMRHLLATLSPSSTGPEEVQGTASRRYPSRADSGNITR